MTYSELGADIGRLVEEKQAAYGSSFSKSGKVLLELYPDGIPPAALPDALTIVRVVDKLFRIATDRDALGESPWRDIAGYALLSVARVEQGRESKALEQARAALAEAKERRDFYGPTPETNEAVYEAERRVDEMVLGAMARKEEQKEASKLRKELDAASHRINEVHEALNVAQVGQVQNTNGILTWNLGDEYEWIPTWNLGDRVAALAEDRNEARRQLAALAAERERPAKPRVDDAEVHRKRMRMQHLDVKATAMGATGLTQAERDELDALAREMKEPNRGEQ